MAQKSGFFNAKYNEETGEYDLAYLAEDFANYFASFIGNGVFAGNSSNALMVVERDTPSLAVKILPGRAWINGYWYENDSDTAWSLTTADGTYDRIDSIVIRWFHVARIIRVCSVIGTPAASPVPPDIHWDGYYHDLRLANVYVKAGATRITQSDIIDTRLGSDCGFVTGLIEQFDTSEFGAQLNAYIADFIAEHDAWKNAAQADVHTWIADFKNASNAWFAQFETYINNAVNNLLTEKQAEINQLISASETAFTAKAAEFDTLITNGQAEINRMIEELDEALANANATAESISQINAKIAEITNKVVSLESGVKTLTDDMTKCKQDIQSHATSLQTLTQDVTTLKSDVSTLKTDNTNTKQSVQTLTSDVSTLKTDNAAIKKDIQDLKSGSGGPDGSGGMGIEDETEIGCYYVGIVDGVKEWINAPNKPGVEYRTIERWNGSPVYTQMLYLGALSNKSVMAITIDVEYNKVFFVSGYAFDPENNMSYPFPIIMNGLTPIAVISGIEGNGSESNIIINVNEDLSAFSGYINIKYIK